MNKKLYLLFILMTLGASFFKLECKKSIQSPQLTVVIVVDQFAHHYFKKLSNYFTHGFNMLSKKGVVFENAYHPHGTPLTSVGHVTISTGAFAKDHGVILNSWIENNKEIKFPQDNKIGSAVLSYKNTMNYGFSGKSIAVDNLSDQFIMSSRPCAKNFVYSISYKPRAAIGMSGKLGKAIWFDKKLKYFTSSNAYFNKIPKWLKNFNKKNDIKKVKEIAWKLSYPQESKAYQFYNIQNYKFTKQKNHIAGQTLKINPNQSGYDRAFQKTPYGNKLLLKLAKKCLDVNLEKLNRGKFLLWVSLSSLDKIGHEFGPCSLEVIDMIYHLDKQIYNFIKYTQDLVGPENALFVLTSDHGVAPIPEILKTGGFSSAQRDISTNLTKNLNSLIENKFGIKKIIRAFKTNQIYLNTNKMETLAPKEKHSILLTLKNYLLKQPAIKNCWTQDELAMGKYSKNSFERFYKNQLYPQRAGHLIFIPQPYSTVIKHEKGTTHRSPYEYDTHVPLIFYQENVIEKRQVNKKVYETQIAPTLAKILKIPVPSASTSKVLPKIF